MKKDIYTEVKELLKAKRQNTRYFNRKTFDIILNDIQAANQIFDDGGDIQAFYKTSETSKTDFYTKNGGAYCTMLEIISGLQLA